MQRQTLEYVKLEYKIKSAVSIMCKSNRFYVTSSNMILYTNTIVENVIKSLNISV